MQALRHRHCTIWAEGVREIVSADSSSVKFVLSDHPVTVFNSACPPGTEYCRGSNDPSIAFKGTHTIFPLDQNHCLILTNLEYAQDPKNSVLTENRTNARTFSSSSVRTDTFIRTRSLSETEIHQVNSIIKARALRYVASGSKDWLYPERFVDSAWADKGAVLLPPEDELFAFGGETYMKFNDGSVRYQDAFGRTTGEPKHLLKPLPKRKIGANERCPCGSGKKFKKCCKGVEPPKRPSWTVRSIRERNLMFYDIVCRILGLDAGKTWDDVRAELSNDQVNEIHEAFGALWPIDTVLAELLPRPNANVSRALYTGIIDPRSITTYATSLILYFDEIAIQNPFINPATVKPDFSPVHSPHQFKQETLKNVLLLIELAPLIERGCVIFVPDPCTFDFHLRSRAMALIEERTQAMSLSDRELARMQSHQQRDLERTLYMVSENMQRKMIRDALPETSEKETDDLVEHLRNKRQQDPLALLQDDLVGDEGQLMIFNLTPNFEMAFFLAQVTGSFLFTDNEYRWKEMRHADHSRDRASGGNWHTLQQTVSDLDLVVNSNPFFAVTIRESGAFADIRSTIRTVNATVQSETTREQIAIDSEASASDLRRAYQSSRHRFESFLDRNERVRSDLMMYTFECKLTAHIPVGGFSVNSVRRLLLSCGIENYRDAVPMVVFVEPNLSPIATSD